MSRSLENTCSDWRYIRINKKGRLVRGIKGPGVYIPPSLARLPDDRLLTFLSRFHQPEEYDLRLFAGLSLAEGQ